MGEDNLRIWPTIWEVDAQRRIRKGQVWLHVISVGENCVLPNAYGIYTQIYGR